MVFFFSFTHSHTHARTTLNKTIFPFLFPAQFHSLDRVDFGRFVLSKGSPFLSLKFGRRRRRYNLVDFPTLENRPPPIRQTGTADRLVVVVAVFVGAVAGSSAIIRPLVPGNAGPTFSLLKNFVLKNALFFFLQRATHGRARTVQYAMPPHTPYTDTHTLRPLNAEGEAGPSRKTTTRDA